MFAEYFRGLAEKQLGKTVSGFDERATERLARHTWPGNLRELNNVVKRAVLLAKGPRITSDCLPAPIASGVAPVEDAENTSTGNGREGLKHASDQAEKLAIMAALEQTRFNKSKAAEVLNIDRKTLYNKLKILGIEL